MNLLRIFVGNFTQLLTHFSIAFQQCLQLASQCLVVHLKCTLVTKQIGTVTEKDSFPMYCTYLYLIRLLGLEIIIFENRSSS